MLVDACTRARLDAGFEPNEEDEEAAESRGEASGEASVKREFTHTSVGADVNAVNAVNAEEDEATEELRSCAEERGGETARLRLCVKEEEAPAFSCVLPLLSLSLPSLSWLDFSLSTSFWRCSLFMEYNTRTFSISHIRVVKLATTHISLA